jgi:hypothetical protein
MLYKLKWRAHGTGPLTPEKYDAEKQAKALARELLAAHGNTVVIDVWNEDETWQIVSPAGVAALMVPLSRTTVKARPCCLSGAT